MSQVLEWRQRLESAHHQLHEVMTELITNKNYSEAEPDCTMSTSLCSI